LAVYPLLQVWQVVAVPHVRQLEIPQFSTHDNPSELTLYPVIQNMQSSLFLQIAQLATLQAIEHKLCWGFKVYPGPHDLQVLAVSQNMQFGIARIHLPMQSEEFVLRL